MPIILFWLFISSLLFATENFSGKDSMNGISFKDYKEFPEKWSLVTIRFRKDTGEMRLTYANDLALKTLKSGSINYPDGSVFAKTGIHTGVDPQFVSSVVPKGIRRYQLMIKNKTKYGTTGGWGYGLFDPEGKTFAEDPTVTQNACYACHTIVENRGDVFSQAFSFTENVKMPSFKSLGTFTSLKFEWKRLQDLPAEIKKIKYLQHKKLRWLAHEKLRKNVFQGTLDELKPILESESRTSKAPALFLAEDNQKFIVVIPTKDDECIDSGAFKIVSTDINLKLVEEKYCTND